MSLRSCGKRSGPKKVSFSLKIQLQFCAAECMLCASMLMSEEAFSSWTSKPWPLRPRPVPNTSVDMASQLVQHVRNALDDLYMGSFDSDLGSLMQKPDQPSLHGAMNTNLLSGIMLFHNAPFKVMILRHPLILMALHILQMMIRAA